jgi:hypothetical protein
MFRRGDLYAIVILLSFYQWHPSGSRTGRGTQATWSNVFQWSIKKPKIGINRKEKKENKKEVKWKTGSFKVKLWRKREGCLCTHAGRQLINRGCSDGIYWILLGQQTANLGRAWPVSTYRPGTFYRSQTQKMFQGSVLKILRNYRLRIAQCLVRNKLIFYLNYWLLPFYISDSTDPLIY